MRTLTVDKTTAKAKGARTLLQGLVATLVLAGVGYLSQVAADTTWHPEWLLPFAPVVAAVLSYVQNWAEDRKADV